MKWPKGRGNQATHVFTHALNKQENKGKGCHELCTLSRRRSVGCHAWLPSMGHRPQKVAGSGAGGAAVKMLSPVAWLCFFTCTPRGRFRAHRESPALKVAIEDTVDKTVGSTRAGDSSALPPPHRQTGPLIGNARSWLRLWDHSVCQASAHDSLAGLWT